MIILQRTLCLALLTPQLTSDRAKFLSTEERIEVQRRLSEDGGLSDDFDLKYFVQAARDWKIWVNMIITIGLFTPLYSISLFLPTIIKAFGYSANKSQLMTVPPYIVACVLTIAGSYVADKVAQKGIFLLGFETVAIIGFLMMITTGNHHIQYAGSFLAAGGNTFFSWLKPWLTSIQASFRLCLSSLPGPAIISAELPNELSV